MYKNACCPLKCHNISIQQLDWPIQEVALVKYSFDSRTICSFGQKFPILFPLFSRKSVWKTEWWPSRKKNGEKKHKKKNFKQLFNKVDIHYRSVGAIVVHAYTWTKEEIQCARDSLYMNWIEAKSIKKTSSRYFWRMNSNSARIVIERITKQTHSKWCARFCVRNSSDG